MKSLYIAVFSSTLLTAVNGETLYYENFSSGELSLTPWTYFAGTGLVDVSSGDFVLTGSNAYYLENAPLVRDLDSTSIRTQVAFSGESSVGIGLAANADLNAIHTYQAGYNPENKRLYVGWNNPMHQSLARENVEFDLTGGEDLILQFDVFENNLFLWAWRPGEPMPPTPQIAVFDDTVMLGPGSPGVMFDDNGTLSSVTYRFIRVDDEPIPDATRCDFDHSGKCDLADIDELLYAGLSSQHALYDLNSSGDVDGADVVTWLTDAGVENIGRPYLTGDVSLDGSVNATDLNALALNWQQDVQGWSAGDFNGNGTVDATDLNDLALNWQASIAAAAETATVPEPSTRLLLPLTMALAVLIFRRRCTSSELRAIVDCA